MKGFHVLYTAACTLTVKSFETSEERTRWIGMFTEANFDSRDDYTIDMTFNGTIERVGDLASEEDL